MARPGIEAKNPARLTTIRQNSSKEPLFIILLFSGSGTNSRGFSTFGYSGATIAKPSPPPPTKTSEITIELLKQIPPQESKPRKFIFYKQAPENIISEVIMYFKQ